MTKRGWILVLIITWCLVLVVPQQVVPSLISANPDIREAVTKAVQYLKNSQNNDGGFPIRPGEESSVAATCWVIMALHAAGEDISGYAWRRSGKSPVDYLENCKVNVQETCEYARILLALSAAGKRPVYRGVDLAEKIKSFQQDDGAFYQPDLKEKGMINAHMWSILALESCGSSVPNKKKALNWLLSRQNPDGGFAWLEGIQSDADDTAVAIQTLVLLGEDPKASKAIQKALSYLKSCQEDSGGFNCGDAWMAGGTNAATDAWVIQGLIAAGEDPCASRWFKNGRGPIDHLISLQKNSGSFSWKEGQESSPVIMTAYALTALAGKPHPVNARSGRVEESSTASKFTDLDPSHWAYKTVMEMVNAGIVGGYPDGTFRPDKLVTRAEFAALLCRGLKLSSNAAGTRHSFVDVSPRYWAKDAVAVVAERGYMRGKSINLFDPEGNITGAEVAVILARMIPPDKILSAEGGPYWYSASVEVARENGLLYPDFDPRVLATRAQCVSSIAQARRLLGLK